MDIEEDIKILNEYINIDRKMRNNNQESDYDKFCERQCIAIENLLAEREENKKYTIHLTDEEYRKVIENAQKDVETKYKKKIEELEKENKRKDMFVKMAKEVIEESILKQKIKDDIDKYIEQRLAELNETGSYILDEGTPKQERLNGMQKGANDIKKILLEDK